MKYKVNKSTELYKRLKEVWDKCDKCTEVATNLAISLGAIKVATRGRNRSGGVDGFYFNYDNTPDKELWTQIDRHNNPRLFYPRHGKKYKVNESLHERIDALPVITFEEYNALIGFESQWAGLTNYKSFGMHMGKDYILIEVATECKYTPLPDMVELLDSEYVKLKKSISPKE